MNAHQAIAAQRIHACRSCGCEDLRLVLDLGMQPIANALLDADACEDQEPLFPLELLVCNGCSLAQVGETIPPEILFGQDYPYFSSFIPALLDHSREHALSLIEECELGSDDLVVEIASNDGYLLRNFVDAGVEVLGIDPASGPVAAAREAGVPTREAYFGRAVAEQLAGEELRANVMLANNVLAHVTDINDFVAGFAVLLADEGFAEFEFPYVRELVERCAFDTIYHEHVFYYSLTALEPLFERHGLYLNDALPLEIHGGTLRLRASRKPGKSARIAQLLREEREIGLDRVDYYANFGEHVAQLREALLKMLLQYSSEGKRIAGYGAAAKGATLLNFVGLPDGLIEYVVDRNTHKVGKLMPGVRIPIRETAALDEQRPDLLLILPWNFADEIIAQQRPFAESGGRFIRAVPYPELLPA